MTGDALPMNTDSTVLPTLAIGEDWENQDVGRISREIHRFCMEHTLDKAIDMIGDLIDDGRMQTAIKVVAELERLGVKNAGAIVDAAGDILRDGDRTFMMVALCASSPNDDWPSLTPAGFQGLYCPPGFDRNMHRIVACTDWMDVAAIQSFDHGTRRQVLWNASVTGEVELPISRHRGSRVGRTSVAVAVAVMEKCNTPTAPDRRTKTLASGATLLANGPFASALQSGMSKAASIEIASTISYAREKTRDGILVAHICHAENSWTAILTDAGATPIDAITFSADTSDAEMAILKTIAQLCDKVFQHPNTTSLPTASMLT
jgi:hypothetical protein